MSRPALRIAAALALCCAVAPGAAQDAAPAATDAELIARLGDPATKDDASRSLVARGGAAAPALVAALPDAKLRPAVIDVITRIGPPAKAATSTLVNYVRMASHSSRLAAARALGAIGADAATALQPLTAWVEDPKGKYREDAVDAVRLILLDAARRGTAKHGPTPVDAAIDSACDWLVRHQGENGAWSGTGFAAHCTGPVCAGRADGDHDVGLTGLAVMALLGNSTAAPGDARRAAVVRGADFIAGSQDKEGFLGGRQSMHACYDHLVGGLALAETLLVAKLESIREPLARAARMAQQMRSPASGGWRYDIPQKGDSDTSVTVWAVKFLTTAAAAGVAVDPASTQGGLDWIEKITEHEFGRTGYQQKGGPPARTQELLERFPADRVETLTACALEIRLSVGQTRRDEPLIAKGFQLLAAKPPLWDGTGAAVDMYYWYHGSVVERAAGGADYEPWRRALVAALLPHQHKAGCPKGSWDAADPWGSDGGRVYATAFCALALEACRDDPADRPPLPTDRAKYVTSLDKAGESEDVVLANAARRAVDEIRAAYR